MDKELLRIERENTLLRLTTLLSEYTVLHFRLDDESERKVLSRNIEKLSKLIEQATKDSIKEFE